MHMQVPLTREAWLLFAVDALAPIFSEKGYALPRAQSKESRSYETGLYSIAPTLCGAAH